MKKTTYLFLACTLLFSCVKEEVLPESVVQEEVKTYTLTIEAGKGERPDSRALHIDDSGSLTLGDTMMVRPAYGKGLLVRPVCD